MNLLVSYHTWAAAAALGMLKQVKGLALNVLSGSGVTNLAKSSAWRQKRLLILAYHGISIGDEHEWNNQLYLPPDLLRQRFQALARGGYRVLPLAEAIERLYAGELPPRSVVLTFDDGNADFFLRACPILAEFGFPSTVYLTTYYAEKSYPVFNVLYQYLLWKGRGKTVDLTGIIPGCGRHALPADSPHILSAIAEMRRSNHPANDELECLARDLASLAGVDYQGLRDERILTLLDAGQLARVGAYGASVQLHTHRHRNPDDEAGFRKEIQDNRRAIESMAHPREPLVHFCYPSGYYRTEYFPWLRSEAIQTATTCVPGLASSHSNPLALPRLIDTCNITATEFEGWLAGVGEWLPRRRTTPE